MNPILNSFQATINRFDIDRQLIRAFFISMEMDLHYSSHSDSSYSDYIYGSAEVVGLMCLYVFCDGNKNQYNKLEPAARSLGAAFQKVNFLRDMGTDYNYLSRIYFPAVDFGNFTQEMKDEIERDISDDFENAYKELLRFHGRQGLACMWLINIISRCLKKSEKPEHQTYCAAG